MTTTYTYLHNVAVSKVHRLDTGTISVVVGNVASLMFDDDAQLKAFISDLSMLRAEMINKALEDRDAENVRLANGNLV